MKYSETDLAAMTENMRNKCLVAGQNATSEDYVAGLTWYERTNEMLEVWAEETGYTLEIAVGVFAIMSANKAYKMNLASAWNILNGTAPMYGTTSEHAKSYAVLEGDLSAVKGPKVTQFFENILRPMGTEAVTIDTIMMGMVGMSPKELDIKGVRDAMKLGIVQAAKIQGLRPNQTQAIAWIYTRGSAA